MMSSPSSSNQTQMSIPCHWRTCVNHNNHEECDAVARRTFHLENGFFVCPQCNIVDRDFTSFKHIHASHAYFHRKKSTYLPLLTQSRSSPQTEITINSEPESVSNRPSSQAEHRHRPCCHTLPHIPSTATRKIVENELNGAYRTVRFHSTNHSVVYKK
jgi:uncharacterized C2H2 Zn-finger protein